MSRTLYLIWKRWYNSILATRLIIVTFVDDLFLDGQRFPLSCEDVFLKGYCLTTFCVFQFLLREEQTKCMSRTLYLIWKRWYNSILATRLIIVTFVDDLFLDGQRFPLSCEDVFLKGYCLTTFLCFSISHWRSTGFFRNYSFLVLFRIT